MPKLTKTKVQALSDISSYHAILANGLNP